MKEAPVPFTEKQERFGKAVIKKLGACQTWVYRKSGGRLWTTFPGGYPINLVTMVGRKSGVPRTTPLIHLPLGDKVVLVASQGGMSKSPNWYFNIAANPDIEVFHRGVTRKMVARQVDDDEKAELWPSLCEIYPDFEVYQQRTERNIPVFVCTELKSD